MTARTRTTDPATSHAAAKTTAAAQHEAQILDALERHDVALSAERIGEITGLGALKVTRRMRDMERAGQARRDGIGRNKAGRAVTLWRRN